MHKISDFIKGSKIGKDLDIKTLKVIDKVFENAVAKGVGLSLNEKVAAENSKFKTDFMVVLDQYIDKIVAEKFNSIMVDKAKVQLAERLIESFKGAFGEMFILEGNTKLAQILKDKIDNIARLEENHKANLDVMKESYEKQVKGLKRSVDIKESKIKLMNNKKIAVEAKAAIDGNKELTLMGKTKAHALFDEAFKADQNITMESVNKIIDKVKRTSKIITDKNEFQRRKVVAERTGSEIIGAKPTASDSQMASYTKQLDNLS